MKLKYCHLIGGAPLSGKTTLAEKLATSTGAVQFSTDNIRDWMRQVATESEYPSLFEDLKLGCEGYYEEFDTAEKVLDQEIRLGRDVEAGVTAFLKCRLPWRSVIIEGVTITPEFSLKLEKEFADVKFTFSFLIDDNDERIRRRINERGLWGPSGTYPEDIKPKEADWVILYNEFFKNEAEKHVLSITHIDELDEALAQVKMISEEK